MDLNAFNKLFNQKVSKLYSSYYGIFDFSLIYYIKGDNHIKNIIYYTLLYMNIGLIIIFKALEKLNLGNKLDNKNFSPFLIYIGKKE